MKNKKCELCEGVGHWYGVAPHRHDMDKTGSIIGSTVILPKEEWPKNFIPDPEDETCGTWFCESCAKRCVHVHPCKDPNNCDLLTTIQ